MNTRERFLATMAFEKADRVPLWEFGYWTGAVRRWYREGLPLRAGVPDWVPEGRTVAAHGHYIDGDTPVDSDIRDLLGLDKGKRYLPLNPLFCPAFAEEVLEDHGEWVYLRDTEGAVRQVRKDRSTVPHYVASPVRGREDWEQLKAERLRPTLEGRLPANWTDLLAEFRRRDYPLCLGGGYAGFFGTPRILLGPEGLLTSYYDDPQLVRDIVDYLADFWIAIYDQVLDQTDADLALIWEDMCYKTGPLISPALFRQFMLPAYRKLTAFLKDRGVGVIFVDTDGDCWQLIPLFLEGGVTGLYPFEANAGMNVVEVRKAFPRLQMLGGIDKMALAAGRAAIDAELEGKVPFMLKSGGYIPTVDHNVPPDVSWDSFAYYRTRLGSMIRGEPGALTADG